MSSTLAATTQKLQIIVHPSFPLLKPSALKRADWQELPLELLFHAARNLNAQDLCRLAAVNRACRSAAGEQQLWKRLCVKFGVPGNIHREPSCWKDLYRYNHQILYDVLLYQRPERANLGGGVIHINLPVPA